MRAGWKARAVADPVIYVCDQDPRVRSAGERVARQVQLMCLGYPDGGSLLEAIDCERPGCVLLDVWLPDMTGLQLQARLRRECVRLPVIFVAGTADVGVAVRAFRGGASDFLLKPVTGRQLLKSVHRVLARQACTAPAARPPDVRVVRARLAMLSSRERQILELILRGRSSKEIADALNRAPKTVEFHRRNLMHKMGATNLAELVRLATLAVEVCPRGR